MYGYKEYEPLNVENILSRVTEKEILGIIFIEDIVVDKGAYYRAPYRNDTQPGCWFEEYNGRIAFIDFADTPPKPKDCFQIIMKTKKLSFYESLELVNSHFNLGLGDNNGNLKEKIKQNDCVEEKNIEKTFKERVITILPRDFNYKDKLFWKQYKISKQNLIEDKVVPVEIYRFISRKGNIVTIKPIDICYAYTMFTNKKCKIYRPYGDKDTKWLTNCNQNDIGCYESLPEEGNLLIITKSYKDCRVLRNLDFHSIWLQNEGMFPSKEILQDLCKRFKKIIVWFDNDSTGITNGRYLVNLINEIHKEKAKNIFLPPILLKEEIKDPSDLISKKGEEELKLFLIKKKLLTE